MYNDFHFSHTVTDNFLAQHAIAHELTYKELHVGQVCMIKFKYKQKCTYSNIANYY